MANHYRQKSRRRPLPRPVRYKVPLYLWPWARGAKRGSRILITQLEKIAKLSMLGRALRRETGQVRRRRGIRIRPLDKHGRPV